MTNLNTITDKDILTQITSEINEFRVMIEHTQSRLII